ncbi:MAG: glycosyltransferase [Candidatus Levybacteria bacterium]|nr:glycosyltransferase [Candidatus Levybacteria bacterium]
MEKKNPLVSVVILAGPNTNNLEGQRIFFNCLKAVCKSSYKNIEIIIVDNNCPLSVSEESKKRHPQVHIIRLSTNTGMYAYNVGFMNSRGKYILGLDDDCIVKKDTISKVVDCFEKNDKKIGAICLNAYDVMEKYYFFNQYLKLSMKNVFIFATGTVAFRKEALLRVGYYDKDFFCWVVEDDLGIRLLQAGYKIYFDKNNIIYHYSQNNPGVRKRKIFLTMRNRAWFNIKHISWYYFPLFVAKDIVWFFLYLFNGSFRKLFWGITGYAAGYISFVTPIFKRKVVSSNIQKAYLKYFLTFWRYRKILKVSTSC